jgi:hypothetical protein
MGSITAGLLELRAPQSPSKVLKEIGVLGQKSFAKALPALRAIAERPVSEVEPDRTLLRTVADKLRSTPEASQGYWPTVLQFAHFATSALNPDAPPPGPPWYAVDRGRGNTFQGSFEKRAFLLGGSTIFKNSVFVKCRIVLEANATVRLENVTFIDCVFDFPPNGESVPAIQEIAKSLLASGFNKASLPPG